MLHGKSSDSNGTSIPSSSANGVAGGHAAPDHAAVGAAYTHILVPTALVPRDRAALLLGLQMAAAYRAKVTLLHVLRPEERANSVHWLDAIDNLHRALSRPTDETAPRGDQKTEPVRARILAFLERTVPAALRSSVPVNAVSRVGDAAHEIARFADQAAVDLVILGRSHSAWKLPLWPGVAQRVMQLTARRVVLVRPDASDHTTVPAAQVAHP